MLSIAQTEFEARLRDDANSIDWTVICRYYNLSEEFIDEFYDKLDWVELNWNLISGVQQIFNKIKIEDIPYPFVDDYIEILEEPNIDNKRSNILRFLRTYDAIIHSNLELHKRTVSDEFMEEYHGFIDWELLTEFIHLSDDSIRKFRHDLDWDVLTYKTNLSWDIIREFRDELNWEFITEHYEFDLATIKEFQNFIDWDVLSIKKNLSIDIIREFQDLLNWEEVSENTMFDTNTAHEFRDMIDWGSARYDNLSELFIRDLLMDYELDWILISSMPYLSKNFIEEFKDQIEWNVYVNNPKVVPILVYKYKDRCTPSENLTAVFARLNEQVSAIRTLSPYISMNAISNVTQYL